MVTPTVNIFWFRRDLRLDDNAGLYYALHDGIQVIPVFIFDKNILDQLEDPDDPRVSFIHQAIMEVHQALLDMGSSLRVEYGEPLAVFRNLLNDYSVKKVFTNHDYEPYAIDRDAMIGDFLNAARIPFLTYKDQVIFEKGEVLKEDEKPYTVFTPYSRRWKTKLDSFYLKAYPNSKYFSNFIKTEPIPVPTLASIGFRSSNLLFPPKTVNEEILEHYHTNRDYPGIRGTSRLSVHLRFGTISIRQLVQKARQLNETYLNELIWRDFYHMILWHFPKVGKGRPFKPEYEKIEWRNNESEFSAWCEGRTGYPIVDAGMRELAQTAYMHNRVRMIVASFLSKHLLVDWRWGEAWFAGKLLDFDLAANNGGWQWAAGCGCDAAPYFRIFNPYIQAKKFDSKMTYVRKWIPELDSPEYPPPIVAHEFARQRCLNVYGRALKRQDD